MKYLQIAFALLIAIGFSACSDDSDSISIDSLNAMGDEFYCNQKVKLWMCVNSSDLWNTTYEWKCDNGTLTQPQGLNEMTWKAPSTPGTYTITCTAKVGGKSETRSHKMWVSSYFFEKFSASSQTSFSLQNAKSSIKTESNGNQYLQATVNSSTEPTRYIRRSFGDDELCVPFSVRAKLGFEANMPTTQTITVGKKTANAVLEYRWNMRSDLTNENNFIKQVRIQWYPHVPTDGYPTLADSTATTVEGTTDWNVRIIAQHISPTGIKTEVNEYHKLNAMNIFQNKSYHTIAMGMASDEILVVFVDGAEVLRTPIVHDLRTEQNCTGNIFISNWEIYQLNGNGARNLPKLYLDDCYASNVDELLK
jgi:hypothetical protein